jgi:hypothetical protein
VSVSTKTSFTFEWAQAAINTISDSANLQQGITATAGFITDIIDELNRINMRDSDFEYLLFVDGILRELGEDDCPYAHTYWTGAEKILRLYNKLPGKANWEIEVEACRNLKPLLDPTKDQLEEVWLLLGNIIAYLQGWTEGEAEGIREASIEDELLRTKGWPESFPEDRPPDGLDDYANGGE